MTSKGVVTSIVGAAFMLSFAVAQAASPLAASCAGVPTATNITWTASTSGGVTPVVFSWGNGSTSTSQTIAVSPGTYSMTLQAIDASSTAATTTCSATVLQPVPTTSTSTPTNTVSDLQTQIQNLLSQIAALQAQIAAMVQTQHNIQGQVLQLVATLHRGMSGDEVRQLQEILATDKDVFSKDNITGFFGTITEEAVKRFQFKFGIDVVGIVGPRTLEKLNELLSEHGVMDDGDFEDREFGDIGNNDDGEQGNNGGEHNHQDKGSMNNENNHAVHNAISTGSSSHGQNERHGNNRQD